MGDSPPFVSSPFLDGLVVFLLVVLAGVVLLTVWTAWRVYRQPTSGRLIEHGVLLLIWLWTWVISGPSYQAKWGNWVPIVYLAHLLLVSGRVVAAQRTRMPRQ